MARQLVPLQQLRVASPCDASWAEMQGDDRVRFCRLCEKNVYNLSALESAAAQALIEEHEGRLCVRFYRRADGTLLTSDCPVGVRRITRRLVTGFAAVVAACLVGWTIGISSERRSKHDGAFFARLRQIKLLEPIIDWLDPSPPCVTMGVPCPPPSLIGSQAPGSRPQPPVENE